MATVTGLTAERMLAIEAASVVDGDIVGDELILTKHDGSQINAGSVTGPEGPTGPPGEDYPVLAQWPVLDVGLAAQARAGRQLEAADFTGIGLSAPLGLWNFNNNGLDASGNGRNLLNKGSVQNGDGINGGANTSARFDGSTAQALYINDAGGSDSFRIRTGSFGCWFKTAKKGVVQTLMAKGSASSWGYFLQVHDTTGYLAVLLGDGATGVVGGGSLAGTVDVCDDRWHHAVVTFDAARQALYVDGVLQHSTTMNNPVGASSGPFNIGANYADAATAASSPVYGRIDEAFITGDVLTLAQVRSLYATKLTHSLGQVPGRVRINAHRRRRGAALISGDFPTQPLRLHNFSAGSLGDDGSAGVTFTNNGTALAVGGADGTPLNAYNFNGSQSLSSTDAGLPSGLNTRSYGLWVKTRLASSMVLMGYGTAGSADTRIYTGSNGSLVCSNGADIISTGIIISDSLWHHVVIVENNSAIDGLKRKVYLDGKLVGRSTSMNSITLAGANRFRVGSDSDGSGGWTGQADAVFVTNYALTAEEIYKLYAKGTQTPPISPRNIEQHIEGMTAAHILAIFDTLDSSYQLDVAVAE